MMRFSQRSLRGADITNRFGHLAPEDEPQALNIVGRPFSAMLQGLLQRVSNASGFKSRYWISARLAEQLGLGVQEDAVGTVVKLSRREAQRDAGRNTKADAVAYHEIALFNADQTATPNLFSPRFCGQQKIPIGIVGRVMTGDAFGKLREAMITKKLASPLWLSKMSLDVLGLELRAGAPSVVLVTHNKTPANNNQSGGNELELFNASATSDHSFLMAMARSPYEPTTTSSATGGLESPITGALGLKLKAHALREDLLDSPSWMAVDDVLSSGFEIVPGAPPAIPCPITPERKWINQRFIRSYTSGGGMKVVGIGGSSPTGESNTIRGVEPSKTTDPLTSSQEGDNKKEGANAPSQSKPPQEPSMTPAPPSPTQGVSTQQAQSRSSTPPAQQTPGFGTFDSSQQGQGSAPVGDAAASYPQPQSAPSMYHHPSSSYAATGPLPPPPPFPTFVPPHGYPPYDSHPAATAGGAPFGTPPPPAAFSTFEQQPTTHTVQHAVPQQQHPNSGSPPHVPSSPTSPANHHQPATTITLDLTNTSIDVVSFESSVSFRPGGQREQLTLSLYGGAVKIDLGALGIKTVMK